MPNIYKGIEKLHIINYLIELYETNPEEYQKQLKDSKKIINETFVKIKKSFNKNSTSNSLDQDIKDGHFD
jgi:hypothetical protein